jgi:Domain of unknown function (DUF4160)
VPRISEFYGIIVAMFYNDHSPPHLHAVYGEHEASIRLADLTILEGTLPTRALRLVRAWATIHRLELQRDWEKARQGLPLDRIAPLE